MEITGVETHVLENETGTQAIPSGNETVSVDIRSVLVEIQTDAGVTGYGESFHHSAALADTLSLARSVEALGDSLLGTDPRPVRNHWHDMYSRIKRTGAYEAVSVLDQALWDLKGKHSGQPVHQLLGGGSDLPAYATFPHEKSVDQLIEAAAYLDDAGFVAMKIVGGFGVDRDRERIETLAGNLPDDFGLAIDANTSYDYTDALSVAETAAEHDLMWFEEPIAHTDVTGIAELRERVSVPIAGYQTQVTHYPARPHLEAGAYDVYQPAIYHGGGVTAAFNVATLVEAWNKRFVPHAVGPAVSYAASVHVAAAAQACSLIEFAVFDDGIADPGQFIASPYVANQDVLSLSEGTVSPPSEPGLGVEIDWDAVEDSRVEDV